MYYYYLLYTKVHNLFVAYIHGNYALQLFGKISEHSMYLIMALLLVWQLKNVTEKYDSTVGGHWIHMNPASGCNLIHQHYRHVFLSH